MLIKVMENQEETIYLNTNSIERIDFKVAGNKYIGYDISNEINLAKKFAYVPKIIIALNSGETMTLFEEKAIEIKKIIDGVIQND